MRADNSYKKNLTLRKTSVRVLWLLLLMPVLGHANLANNPSMEGPFISQPPPGDVAEYWTAWTEAGGASAGDFSQGSVAHDGTKSQEIQWDGWGYESFGHDGIYQQISSLQPGQAYRVSVWFKFHFSAQAASGGAYGNIYCKVGTDPNGGTDPDVVTNWNSALEDGGGDLYEGPWFNVVTLFSPEGTTATVFIMVNGNGDAVQEDWMCPEPPCAIPAYWDAYCYIDDVLLETFEIGQASTVTVTTPVPANGASYSEVTITVLDPNSNPIVGLPASIIDVNCTGSSNLIFGPDTPTDENGQTTARITSTVAEIKTVSAAGFGTALSDTPTVQFCESGAISKLRASDGAANDRFGVSVSTSGDYAIVGAREDDDNGPGAGSAYIFAPNYLNPNNWGQQAKLTASDGATGDYFGESVSISGNYAIVGAYGDDDKGSLSGSAYIFKRDPDSESWGEQAKLTAPDGAANDYFGNSVSISGNYAVVGARRDDDNGSYSGSAYVFNLRILLGDFDGDGDVDLFDFSILGDQWLQVPRQPSADAAPCGGDCIVDGLDLALFCDHWLE